MSKPLTNLVKKNNFDWKLDSSAVFDKLKKAITSAPVLALPDFREEFILETDASDLGVGAVLSQCGRPIAFMSWSLSDGNLSLSICEKEMLAIVMAIQKPRPNILGRHFKVKTDH